MDFKVSNIFRDVNHCVDKLTALGLENREGFKWFSIFPPVISLDFFHNRILLPIFKFV